MHFGAPELDLALDFNVSGLQFHWDSRSHELGLDLDFGGFEPDLDLKLVGLDYLEIIYSV